MAIFEKDCTSVEYEEGTLGGKTFYVCHPKWDNKERAICFRPVKNIPIESNMHRHGALCEREAGKLTDHHGEGACRTHGGMNGRNNKSMKHGKRANATKKIMRNRIEDYMANDDKPLMDLSLELTTMRVLFEDLIGMFPDAGEDDYGIYVNKAIAMVQAAGSLVDKISRIEARNTITANQIVYLRIAMVDMFVKYIKDPEEREQAVKELVSRIPGGDTEALESMATTTIEAA